MTCRENLPLIDDLVDGCLKGATETEIKSHLTECRDCHGEYQKTKSLKTLLKKYNRPALPSGYLVNATSLILGRIAVNSKSQRPAN